MVSGGHYPNCTAGANSPCNRVMSGKSGLIFFDIKRIFPTFLVELKTIFLQPSTALFYLSFHKFRRAKKNQNFFDITVYNTAIETTKYRCPERKSNSPVNSHLRVSSYCVTVVICLCESLIRFTFLFLAKQATHHWETIGS